MWKERNVISCYSVYFHSVCIKCTSPVISRPGKRSSTCRKWALVMEHFRESCDLSISFLSRWFINHHHLKRATNTGDLLGFVWRPEVHKRMLDCCARAIYFIQSTWYDDINNRNHGVMTLVPCLGGVTTSNTWFPDSHALVSQRKSAWLPFFLDCKSIF